MKKEGTTMQGQNREEKRTDPRLHVPVYVEAFEETFPLGTLLNMSTRGMFVQSTEPKEVGTQIDISFQLPDTETWIQLKAKVVWVNRPPSFSADEPYVPASRLVDDNPGMGLNILSIAPETKSVLETFIQDQEKDA
jgi:hypothetical protein